jgi:hypothetical protein
LYQLGKEDQAEEEEKEEEEEGLGIACCNQNPIRN